MSQLRPQGPGIPLPVPSELSRPYWDACRAGVLSFQRCRRCGTISPRPLTRCGACQSDELGWEASAGTGSLYSWTVTWRPQHPSFEVPYAPAIVELDEGYWWVSAVIGCAPEELSAGLRLAVEFHPAGGDVVLPYFRPVAEAAA